MSWWVFVSLMAAGALVCMVISLGIWMQSHLDRTQVDYIKQLREERRQARRVLQEEFRQQQEMNHGEGA